MSTQPLQDIMGQVMYPELRDHMVQQGERGRNPMGRPRRKLLSDAMARKLAQQADETGETVADRIADKVALQAQNGDLGAVVIMRDSTEGRPAQAIQLDAHIQTETTEERRARLLTIIQALAAPQEQP